MVKKISFLLKREYLILYFIIFVGSLLRFPGIFTNSFAFTYDVGRDMLALWNIAYLHKIPLIGATTGLPGVFYGPWWYLILFPFFLLFAGSPQGLTFIIAFFGMLTVVFAFLFGKRLGGVLLGLSFASVVSVSPTMISLSSQIWNPNLIPIFIVLVLLILYQIYSEEIIKLKYFFLLGFLLFLISDLEIVFGFLFLIGISISVLVILNKKLSLKPIIPFLSGGFIILAPRILFELRHGFLMTKSFINFLTIGSSSQNPKLIEVFINRLNMMFDQFNSTIAVDNKLLGLIVLLFIVFSVIVFFKKANEMNKKFIKTSSIVIFTFLVGLTFFKHDIWPHYLVGLPVFYILLFGISLYLLGQRISALFPALIVLVFFLINLNPITLYQNLTKPLWVGDASVYRNQLAVIDYVYGQANGKSFKDVVYTPPVHDYTYQYLFKWYGPAKYHYLPNNNSSLAYFILEPDLQYPSRLIDWLKSREKDGKVIKTEKLKSGIIVQTRIH